MNDKVILLVLNVVAYFFCLPFGYLLTGYIHGGQIVGLLFAVLFSVYSLLALATKNRTKHIFRILAYGFAATMIPLGITLQIIITRPYKSPWRVLYGEHGIADPIIYGFGLVGLIITLVLIRKTASSTTPQ